MREKYEPHKFRSAIGTTGRLSSWPSSSFITPPLNGCNVPSLVKPPSGKMHSSSPSASTARAWTKAAS